MSDDPLVQSLHAAISRRSWNEVERAANAIRDDKRIKWPDRTLMHVGDVATREMAEHGDAPSPVFHQAAMDAARAAGLSDQDIADMYGQDSQT